MEKAPAAPHASMVSDLVTRFVKYALEGLAVAVAAYLLPGKVLKFSEIAMIALVALATFVTFFTLPIHIHTIRPLKILHFPISLK